jgi:hypothetical protein
VAATCFAVCRPSPIHPLVQANIYSPERTFYSFKQVVRELNSHCMLVSLHSTSKVGTSTYLLLGECMCRLRYNWRDSHG